jgi:GAF domain-containing protein
MPEGPMTRHAGINNQGDPVDLNQLKLKEKINKAIDNKHFLLIPQVSAPIDQEKIRSALIAPVVDPSGCFGVLYADNSMECEHYSLSDLDYLMLLTVHTAAILENF